MPVQGKASKLLGSSGTGILHSSHAYQDVPYSAPPQIRMPQSWFSDTNGSLVLTPEKANFPTSNRLEPSSCHESPRSRKTSNTIASARHLSPSSSSASLSALHRMSGAALRQEYAGSDDFSPNTANADACGRHAGHPAAAPLRRPFSEQDLHEHNGANTFSLSRSAAMARSDSAQAMAKKPQPSLHATAHDALPFHAAMPPSIGSSASSRDRSSMAGSATASIASSVSAYSSQSHNARTYGQSYSGSEMGYGNLLLPNHVPRHGPERHNQAPRYCPESLTPASRFLPDSPTSQSSKRTTETMATTTARDTRATENLKSFPITHRQASRDFLLDEVMNRYDPATKRGLMRKRECALRSTLLRTNATQMHSNLSSKLASLTGAQTIGEACFTFNAGGSAEAFAVLHCFKTIADSAKEEERLTLTSSSYAAVAESVPTFSSTQKSWGLRVTGLMTSSATPKSRATEQQHVEWILLFDAKHRMMHWQTTLRALIEALNQADREFRSSVPLRSSGSSGGDSSPLTPISPEWSPHPARSPASDAAASFRFAQKRTFQDSPIKSDFDNEAKLPSAAARSRSNSLVQSYLAERSFGENNEQSRGSSVRDRSNSCRSSFTVSSGLSQPEDTHKKRGFEVPDDVRSIDSRARISAAQLARSMYVASTQSDSTLPRPKSTSQASMLRHRASQGDFLLPLQRAAPRDALPLAPGQMSIDIGSAPTFSSKPSGVSVDAEVDQAIPVSPLAAKDDHTPVDAVWPTSRQEVPSPQQRSRNDPSQIQFRDGAVARRMPSRSSSLRSIYGRPAILRPSEARPSLADTSYSASPYTSFLNAASTDSDVESLIDDMARRSSCSSDAATSIAHHFANASTEGRVISLLTESLGTSLNLSDYDWQGDDSPLDTVDVVDDDDFFMRLHYGDTGDVTEPADFSYNATPRGLTPEDIAAAVQRCLSDPCVRRS